MTEPDLTGDADLRAEQGMSDHLAIAVMHHRIARRALTNPMAVYEGSALEPGGISVLDLAAHVD